MNIKPAFSFSIDMKLSEKGVAVGKYDGESASLTAITQSNKVNKIKSLAVFFRLHILNYFRLLYTVHINVTTYSTAKKHGRKSKKISECYRSIIPLPQLLQENFHKHQRRNILPLEPIRIFWFIKSMTTWKFSSKKFLKASDR